MFSASSEARNRNAPTNANQIRLQTSRIGQEHRPIRYQLPARLSFRQGQAKPHSMIQKCRRVGAQQHDGASIAPRGRVKPIISWISARHLDPSRVQEHARIYRRADPIWGPSTAATL